MPKHLALNITNIGDDCAEKCMYNLGNTLAMPLLEAHFGGFFYLEIPLTASAIWATSAGKYSS